ncbi:MAG TPA: universal stress protein [Casimicrobiaceae bacterium]|nr:universal stress protein [Casimicrobiaceae bacterium]
MAKILIPFTEPDGAERAILRLIDERPPTSTSVYLLAVVEPLTPGKVSIYLSEARSEEMVRAAAARWIDNLEGILKSAGIQCSSEIAVGSSKELMAAAMARPDIDRVLLPARSPHWWARWTAARRESTLTRASHRPVSVVP